MRVGVDPGGNPSGFADQDIYLKALIARGSVDHIEYGYYVSRVKRAPLATPDKKGRPVLTTSQWPVMIRDDSTTDIPHATFMGSYAYREEKGSDVNVAAHSQRLCKATGLVSKPDTNKLDRSRRHAQEVSRRGAIILDYTTRPLVGRVSLYMACFREQRPDRLWSSHQASDAEHGGPAPTRI
jgi:hypothetical protein